MTATVHALPVQPDAHVSRITYDSHTGHWAFIVSEWRDDHPEPDPVHVPRHVMDALDDFANGNLT